MKKIMIMMLALLSIAGAWALTGGSGQGYDPTNPPDPNTLFRLTVTSSPSHVGSVSPAGASMRSFGDEVYVRANSHTGYDFRCWMEGDSVVSTSMGFYFTMPDRNVTLTAWYDRNMDYNPTSPGDPFFDGYTHRVNVYCTPSSAGRVSPSNFLMKEGEETVIRAYANSNYKFSCWKEDGKIISVDPSLPVKMGTKNLTYTAQFVYTPQNPGDPGTNCWNPGTGELIIDDFRPGDLNSKIYEMTGGDMDAVNTLTVIGPMNDYDFGAVSGFNGLTEVDFSRTSGVTRVPDWSLSYLPTLVKVTLPESVNRMENYTFYDSPNLSELVCLSAMPPALDYPFYGVQESLVVKVYSTSADLYQTANGWSGYQIRPLDREMVSLNVTLPEDAADGRYANATLQLNNLSTGQSRRLVITPTRSRYSFSNLIPGSKYSLYALAPNGRTLGQYPDFEMGEESMEYEFPSLRQLQTVTLSLKGSDGKDLSGIAQVNWFDEKHDFLAAGGSLLGQVESYEVYYEIIPSQEMKLAYILPPLSGSWKVKEADNQFSVTADPISRTFFKGSVYDSAERTKVAGAYVTLTQTINGEQSSVTVATDKEGDFSLEVADLPGSLTAGSPEHIEETVAFSGLKDLASKGEIPVKPIYGASVYVSMLTAENVEESEKHVYKPFEDTANVSFSITDAADGRPIFNHRLRYPLLRLLDPVGDDAQIRLVAIPRGNGFNPDAADVKLKGQEGQATLTFLRDGDLTVSIKSSEAENPVALLYDAKGMLLRRADFNSYGKASFQALPEGDYTVVAMANSSLYSGAGTLAELAASPLEEKKDYLLAKTSVSDGYLYSVELGTVPQFDESAFYYTGPNTMLTLNKTAVTVGQNVTVRSLVDFLPEYEGRIDKVKMTFTIPEGLEYVDGSLLVGGYGSNFTTIADGQLSVETYLKDASPRFCLAARKSGDWRITGSVEFWIDGQTISQPFGAQLLSVSDFSISAPDYTYIPRVTVRGFATPLSEIRVYDNDVPVGRARSLTNGEWRLSFDLYEPGDYSEHLIYADITTADGDKYLTSTAKTIYDPDWAQLTDVLMINGGTTVDFNHVEATTLPGSYTYIPGTDMFTFKAIYRDGKATEVKSLDFLILLSDGSQVRMDSRYIPSQDAWVCAKGFPDISRLPVNVKVIASTVDTIPVRTIEVKEKETMRCPDVVPVIDPSGYVYEAVPSNRLEGVQATIFYKEWAEDMYGDVYEKVIRWDAEAYAQQNPLFTDADGMYQWDVPSGEWQVRFEKSGYEPAATEWLPVPPPQLDVNMGLVQLAAPQVEKVTAYDNAVEVIFDKYMQPARFNDANIAVTVEDDPVKGVFSLVDAEEAPDGETYARGFRFETENAIDADKVNVMLGSQLCSYAGIPMEAAFTQEFDVEREISAIEAPEEVKAFIGNEILLSVQALPGEAAEGKRLTIDIPSPIASLVELPELDAEGRGVIRILGELPGNVTVKIGVEGSKTATASTLLSLAFEPETCAMPIWEVLSGTGSHLTCPIILTTATPQATIIYTVDGSDPTSSETARTYTGPFYYEEDPVDKYRMRIRAIARRDGWYDSPEMVEDFIPTEVKEITANESVSISGSLLTAKDDCTVTVFDLDGRMVLNASLHAGDTLSLSSLASGIYIVKTTSADQAAAIRLAL